MYKNVTDPATPLEPVSAQTKTNPDEIQPNLDVGQVQFLKQNNANTECIYTIKKVRKTLFKVTSFLSLKLFLAAITEEGKIEVY